MSTLAHLGEQIHRAFPSHAQGQERAQWFLLTLQSILMPLTASRTSNLLRTLATVFGRVLPQSRFYTFMASPKLPWDRLWTLLWRSIPEPLTEGRLLIALDDSINPKTGQKIFGCERVFDHAAKTNQASHVWGQVLVTLGLLRQIHGRWACLPLAFAFYLRRVTVRQETRTLQGQAVPFATKFAQAVARLRSIGAAFPQALILVVADSWFGNQGLWRPLSLALGRRAHLLSRLRVNHVLYDLPPKPEPGQRAAGRPRKYGPRLGQTSILATRNQSQCESLRLPLYGREREVQFVSRIVMLKSLRTPVRVVWIYRRVKWVALFTTDLTLSVAQIITYYGARWKIEAGFREIKQEIGSAQTQARTPDAVNNHLNFCMAATTLTWIYGACRTQAPPRRYATRHRREYAFADLRRAFAQDLSEGGFGGLSPKSDHPEQKPMIATLLSLAA